MRRHLALLALLGAIWTSSRARDVAEPGGPPLEVRFLSATGTLFADDYGHPSCGVPRGRQQCYDPRTGVFHVQVNVYGEVEVGFEVTKVSDRLTEPIAFRLTRMPYHHGCLGLPLNLSVKGKHYPLDEGILGKVDPTLFRVRRDGDAALVVFTESARKLLQPGARIGYSVDNNW